MLLHCSGCDQAFDGDAIKENFMSWKKGPLPSEGVWGWGGVVPINLETRQGFFFADFQGHKVIKSPGTKDEQVLQAHEIEMYNNCLELPPAKDSTRL